MIGQTSPIDVPPIDWIAVAPPLALFAAALLVVLLRSLVRHHPRVFDASLVIAIVGVATSGVFTAVQWHYVHDDGPYQALRGMIAVDGFAVFVMAVVLGATLLALLTQVSIWGAAFAMLWMLIATIRWRKPQPLKCAVACAIRQTVNLVAFFDPSRGHVVRPKFLNHTGHVPTGYERERVRDEIFHVTAANFPIDRIHTSGMDSDQDFARSWLRTRRILILEYFRTAVVVNSNRLHVRGLICPVLFCGQRSAAHRALEKDYVSCLSITKRHTVFRLLN